MKYNLIFKIPQKFFIIWYHNKKKIKAFLNFSKRINKKIKRKKLLMNKMPKKVWNK